MNTQQLTRTSSLLGTSAFLTDEGELVSVDTLAYDYGEKAYIASIGKHSKLKFHEVSNFRPSDLTASRVKRLHLSSGQLLIMTDYDSFESPSGEIIDINNIKVGSVLKSALYDRNRRYIQFDAVRVESMYDSKLPETVFLFDFDLSDDMCSPLVSYQVDDKICMVIHKTGKSN